MALIHVARDGAKLGEFTLEQIRDGLGTGQFRATDLGWQSGMTEWRPLGEIIEMGTPASEAAPALPGSVAGVSSAGAETGLPWEHREQLGFFKAFFSTVSLVITRPSLAFTVMRREGGLTSPLLFGLIAGCAAYVVSLGFQALLESVPGYPGNNEAFHLFGLTPWVLALIYTVLAPVSVLLGIFIGGGVLHLCLMLVGGANRPFENT
jgi:hypothetical protein